MVQGVLLTVAVAAVLTRTVLAALCAPAVAWCGLSLVTVVGVVAGALVLAVVTVIQKLRGR